MYARLLYILEKVRRSKQGYRVFNQGDDEGGLELSYLEILEKDGLVKRRVEEWGEMVWVPVE